MRRFMLPIFAGFALAATLTGCNDKTPDAAASPTVSVAPSPTKAKGDDKAACTTAKTSRTAVLNDLIMAMLAVSDEDSTKEDLADAAKDLDTALTKLSVDMAKAAGQADSDKLREALTAYAAGARTAAGNVVAAGTDAAKLDAAIEVPAMDEAEKTVMTICA